MKKFIYSSLILGSAFALASCSADEPGAAKGDGTTTLTVQLPGDLATRYGEGTSVTTLYYSVFPAGTVADADGNLPAPLISGSQEWPAGQTTTSVELTLVPGDDYDVVFFADNSAAEESGAYTYNVASGNLSIDYTKIASNSDAYDAFFNKVEGLNTTFTDVIELNRPFAQLNIGTNDYNLGVVENHLKNGSYSSTLDFKTTGLASGVNFMTNTYTAATDPFTVSIDELSTKTFGFPAGEENEYAYLEMNYLLVDPATDAPTLVEATYTVTAGTTEVNKLDLTNLPLRANYQTNVYGALLTTKSTFNVEIKPGFALPDYNIQVPVWDGVSTAMPKIENGVATIENAAELVGLARTIGDAKNNSIDHGVTDIVLNSDLDLGGNSFLGIGRENVDGEDNYNSFPVQNMALKINFDGQGHTIRNYKMDHRRYGRGLLNNLSAGSSVKNLIIEDVVIDSEPNQGNISGIVAGYSYGCVFENITVRNCTIVGYGKNGAVVGCCSGSGTTQFINCAVENVTIHARYENGGILGILQGNHVVSFTNCPEPEVTFIQYRDNLNTNTDGSAKNGFLTYSGPIQHYKVVSKGVPDLNNPMPTTLSDINAEMFWEKGTKLWIYATFGKYYTYQSQEAIAETSSLYTLTIDGALYLVADTPVNEPVFWPSLIIDNPDYKAE